MKNNIDYYQHFCSAHNHRKFKMLRVRYGWAGEGKFWALNNLIGDSENCKIDLNQDYNKASIALDLDFDIPAFDEFISYLTNNCKLVVYQNGFLTTETIQENLARVTINREKARKRKEDALQRFAENKKSSPELSSFSTDQNKKVKESKVKKSKVNLLDNINDQINFKLLNPKHELQIWIEENCLNVSKMKSQLSFTECENVISQNLDNKDIIYFVLNQMDNKVDLVKKYVSVYKTLLAWLKNYKNWNDKNGKNSSFDKSSSNHSSGDFSDISKSKYKYL